MTYSYKYITESTFSPAVEWHFFKLRAIPCNNEFQRTEGATLEILPACLLCHSVDGQGNAVQWGSYDSLHGTFKVISEGKVTQRQPYAIHESPAPYYLTATPLTAFTEKMQRVARQRTQEANGVFEKARCLMRLVHYNIAYTPCHTTTATTAAEVFNDPRGVCQDYAHVMISLCRSVGIHARYVNGFISGEGQTHAWVEVSDGQVWLPFDPTHDKEPEWGYIKIAHGRDADDCPTNRGRFYSWTSETQSVLCVINK